MAVVKGGDKYPQFMTMGVMQSAVNALTFARVGLGMSIFDYAAMIIPRIEYFPSFGCLNELLATGNRFTVAITGSQSVTALVPENPEVYDSTQMISVAAGAPSNLMVYKSPIVHDFADFAGGGLLVPAQDVFIALSSVGFGNAVSIQARVWYQVIKLAAVDYIELVQRMRVLGT